MTEIPQVLERGVTFLRYLKEPFGIIPIRIVAGKKRPMVKIKDHQENITRYSNKNILTATLDIWERAEYYGLVVSPRFNPDIKKQLIIVDVDVPSPGGHTTDGRVHLDKLDLQDTLTIQTGSGGTHYYYWVPMGHRFNPKPHDGIDIVHMSPFYAIGPGNNGYKITKKVEIADASEELIKQLKVQPKSGESVRSDIFEKISDGIPRGERHDTLLKLMASMVGRQVPKDVAVKIGEWAISKCDATDGIPTVDEIESQYDDAKNKFTPSGQSMDFMLNDLILISSLDKVKRKSHPSAAGLNLSTIQIIYPFKVPNINKMPRDDGTYPFEPAGKVWKESDKKIIVDWVGYHPGEDMTYVQDGQTYFNSYSMPKLPTPLQDDLLIQLFQSVFKRTYGPIYEDWLKVIKYKVMNPEVKFNWCIYVTSEKEGTGKGLSFRFTQTIFGSRNCLDVKMHAFEERFNNSWTESTFALVDEAHGSVTRASRNRVMNAIKRIITEDTMTIERKGADKQIGIPAHFFLYIFSNDATSLDLNRDSRRFLVHHDFNPITSEEKAKMNKLAPHLTQLQSVATIMNWIMETVDVTESENFNPKGEARKTKDLTNPDFNNYVSDTAELVMDDIRNHADVFASDVLTTSQFEYYCNQRFTAITFGKVLSELRQLKALQYIPQPFQSNRRTVKKSFIHKLDMSLCKSGINLRDAYLPEKFQYNIVVCRNFDMWKKATSEELRHEIDKNGPQRRVAPLTTVDK